MYRKLTNAELNLASSWERFQMERYGNVLQPPFDPTEDDSRWTPGDRMEAEREMELFNPNNE